MQKLDPATCPVGETPEPPYFFASEEAGPDPFASPIWTAYSQSLIRSLQQPPRLSARGLARRIVHGHPALGSQHVGLYRAAREVLKSRPRVSVLDVGGGCGENYVAMSRALGRLDYTVVENAQNCMLGRAAFPGARFVTDIPDKRFDIAAVIGTLQYIPDWRDFLTALKERCERIVIARTPLRLSGSSFPVAQAVCPEFGEHAGRKAGTARLIIISLAELREAMGDCEMIEDRQTLDYSSHLSRLPKEFRNVAYRSMSWRNARGACAHPGEDSIHRSAALGIDRRAA